MNDRTNETPAMAVKPTHVRTWTVSWSSVMREFDRDAPTFDERVEAVLAQMEESGYELVDIRFEVMRQGNVDEDFFAFLIGRKR